MNKIKSPKNKTIDFKEKDMEDYINRCLSIDDLKKNEEIINKTINGDTQKIMKLIPDKYVDLIIVDPPYNLFKNYHGNKFDRKKEEDYLDYTRDWMIECKRILKDNGTIYVCCDWASSLIIQKVLNEFFNVRNRITWERSKGRGSKDNWKNNLEDIWYATNSNSNWTFNIEDVKIRRKVIAPYKVDEKPRDWEETKDGNYRNSYPSNLWNDITIPYWSMPENTEHPTQKPEKLIAKLILASSNANDIVFDPFLGSGTTSVVSKKLNRKYIGIEQNKRYCGWAEFRLEQANENKEIQGYTNGVFWERNTLSEQNKEKNKVK